MGAKVSSYLQIPKDEFSRGVLAQERNTTDWPTLAQELVSTVKKKDKCMFLAERRLPVLTAAAAARFGCQPEHCRKIFPSAEM